MEKVLRVPLSTGSGCLPRKWSQFSSKVIQAQWLNFLCLFRARDGKNGKKTSLCLVLVSYCKYSLQFISASFTSACSFSALHLMSFLLYIVICDGLYFTSVAGWREPFPPLIGVAAHLKASIYGQQGLVHRSFTQWFLFFFL